ncbi:MAG: alpha/beta hydrolase [Cyclobacteriaceae bacterium]|jgi:pimeloyl-ACP methyl ester carboxylesterase|nr:alpha/beta hydrolase [Cyclobacteriaceae bacterium]
MKTKTLFTLLLLCSIALVRAQSPFHVAVKGKGQPILLFPGFGCPGEVWDEAVAELSKTHQCHVFTFAGFGNVPPIEGPWLEKIKNGVLAYVKENRLARATLLGHSLGGTLSLWLASTEPGLFARVIAVDALPCSAALMIPNYRGEPIAYDNPQSNTMMQMDSAAFNSTNAQSMPYLCRNTEKQKLLLRWMNQADRKTYVHGYIDMLNLDLRAAIAQITIPVVVLGAANPDRDTVEKTYRAQYEKLPATIFHYAENSAHFVMYDQPQWLLQKLTEQVR